MHVSPFDEQRWRIENGLIREDFLWSQASSLHSYRQSFGEQCATCNSAAPQEESNPYDLEC